MHCQPNPKSAYEILGVHPEDDAATIRQAWIKLLRSYRPEISRGDKSKIKQRLAAIDQAFEIVDTRAAFEQMAEERASRREEPVRAAPEPMHEANRQPVQPQQRPAPMRVETRMDVPELTPRYYRPLDILV